MSIRTSIARVIVCIYIAIACFGNYLAPHDARAKTAVYQDATVIIAPPFPLGTPGYFLGSDQFGRDVLSRLLVGTRPTLLAIFVIAVLRIVLGYSMAIVMTAAPPWLRTIAATFTALCGILPPFMGALLVLSLAGTSPSLAVFIIALSWNSWVDCARDVTYRFTQAQQQTFYHAARSSGDTEYSIMVRHGGRTISAPLLSLFITELHTALGLLAMMGFLGYFVGGATWMIIAGDAVPIGARASDYPELGQLLATSFERVLRPEYLFVVGSYIALLMIGLQQLTTVSDSTPLLRPPWFNTWRNALEWGIARRHPLWLLLVPLSVIATIVVVLMPVQPHLVSAPRAAPLIMRRAQPWGMVGGDASMSYRTPIIHTFINPSQLSSTLAIQSAPVIGVHGDVYVYADQQQLIHWDSNQREQRIQLPFQPLGTPALDTHGRVVIVSPSGHIAHLDGQGNPVLQYHTITRAQATSSAVVGPNDMVAVTVVDRIETFDARGQHLWATNAIAGYHETAPVFAPDGHIIMLANQAFDVLDGGRLPLFAGDSHAQFENPRLISGADGYVYRRSGHQLTQLSVAGFVPSALRIIDWDAAHVTMFFPEISGVTAEGMVWQLYTGYGNKAILVWMAGDGAYTTAPLPAHPRLVAVADDATVLICSNQRIMAFHRTNAQPAWQYDVPAAYGACLGGAISASHTVVAYEHGMIWHTHIDVLP